MAEVVSVDRAGRILIPKSIREAANIDEKTKLIITLGEQGRLYLQKLDVEAIASRLEEELKGKDIEAILRNVREEMNARVRERHPSLSA